MPKTFYEIICYVFSLEAAKKRGLNCCFRAANSPLVILQQNLAILQPAFPCSAAAAFPFPPFQILSQKPPPLRAFPRFVV